MTFDALAPAFVSGRFGWIANPALLFSSEAPAGSRGR